MTVRLTLDLDEEDYKTIMEEVRARGSMVLPDGESNMLGAMLAEMVRDLCEYRGLYDSEHNPDNGGG